MRVKLRINAEEFDDLVARLLAARECFERLNVIYESVCKLLGVEEVNEDGHCADAVFTYSMDDPGTAATHLLKKLNIKVWRFKVWR
jgi:hypothetical protein